MTCSRPEPSSSGPRLFEPAVRDGNIYARGSVDDEGRLVAHRGARGACMARGAYQVNVIVLAEGEEEVG